MDKRLKAFTIIEMLIVLGVLFLLGFLVLPIAVKEIQAGKTDSFIKDLDSALRLLSQDAFSRKNDKDYGIALFSDHYTIFVGPSLSEAEDEIVYEVVDDVVIQNIDLSDSGSEVVFLSGSQKPDVYGSFEIVDLYSIYRFSINKEGLITYIKL